MSLIARLRAYAADAFGVVSRNAVSDEDDEHLAATALLVHVARADGTLAPVERERLARLVEGRYASSRTEADALIARAVDFDTQTRDMAMLVELMGHELDVAERGRLLVMAWSVAGADGAVHEFEEALVWRLGGLLGLDEEAIAEARHKANSVATNVAPAGA